MKKFIKLFKLSIQLYTTKERVVHVDDAEFKIKKDFIVCSSKHTLGINHALHCLTVNRNLYMYPQSKSIFGLYKMSKDLGIVFDKFVENFQTTI